MTIRLLFSALFMLLATAGPALAATGDNALTSAAHAAADFTQHWAGYAALALFGIAYSLVMLEENIHLKKSKPVMLFAGLIWILVAWCYREHDMGDSVATLLRHALLEYAELMLFLMAAMSYINTLEERKVFDALRGRLIAAKLSLRALFWTTGAISFVMSPVADNLTTALVMGAVVVALGKGSKNFVAVACINIVVAANAGGVFSPFGDITTLMVWQDGKVEFHEFLVLFIPALVSWLLPAAAMSLTVPKIRPQGESHAFAVKPGGYVIAALFILTIAGTVVLHHVLNLPPFLGMMTGLGMLKIYGYFIERRELREWAQMKPLPGLPDYKPAQKPFDIFISLQRVEWDTLLFFYGVLLCVAGLGAFGYLAMLSDYLYQDLGATHANVLVGLLSAVVDNIPIMFSVLTMDPAMTHGQWLLVTLTAGIGGSLLSIGSAAGVALMGQARGTYTFGAHLKWAWIIALGYAAGIMAHIQLNGLE